MLSASRFDRTVHSLDQVGAGDRDGICDGFHSEPALGSFHDGAAMSFFCSCDVESLLQNLGSHGLAAEQALKLSQAAFEFSNLFRADHILIARNACSPLRACAFADWTIAAPRLATEDPDLPSPQPAGSARRRPAAPALRRGDCFTRGKGADRYIVAIMSVYLCLIELRYLCRRNAIIRFRLSGARPWLTR